MFWNIFVALFIIALVLFLHKLIIKPYLAVQFYKKQGFKLAVFRPFLGLSKIVKKSLEESHDFQYFRKHLLEDYPGTRGVVSNILDKPHLMLADVSLKKDFFLYKSQYYEKHSITKSGLKNDIIEKKDSLLLAEGSNWKRIRGIISSTFNHDFIMSNVSFMFEATDKVFNNIKDLKNVNLVNEFQTITGSVILRSMLGEDFLESKYKGVPAPVALSTLTAKTTGQRFSLINIVFGKKIAKLFSRTFREDLEEQQDFANNFLMKYIEKKFEEFKLKLTENPNFKDKYLIESLFRLVLKEQDGFTLDEVLSNINILFLAGTETTAHLSANIIYVLSKNPSIYQKLMEEFESNSSSIDNMEIETIKNLEYLHAIIKESLRLVSPSADILLRVANKNHMLGDLSIKKGTGLSVGLSINFFDPKIFKNPFDFVPERWIKSHELFANAEENDPYCFLPFSAGARNCIGQHMALIEAKIVLVRFLRRFKFQMKVKEPVTWVMKFVIETKEPLVAELKETKHLKSD